MSMWLGWTELNSHEDNMMRMRHDLPNNGDGDFFLFECGYLIARLRTY